MITCVYHPIDAMRVVEQEDAERMKESGVWFDSPHEAKQYRAKVEDEIKQESLSPKLKIKRKTKGKHDER